MEVEAQSRNPRQVQYTEEVEGEVEVEMDALKLQSQNPRQYEDLEVEVGMEEGVGAWKQLPSSSWRAPWKWGKQLMQKLQMLEGEEMERSYCQWMMQQLK